MSNIALVFGSRHGQTARIAARLAQRLRYAGNDVQVRNVRDGWHYDAAHAVIVGSPVHMQKHLPEVVQFVRRHRDRLRKVPSGFFSVSLALASSQPEQQAAAVAIGKRIEEDTGWAPSLIASFAGALAYKKYGLILRWIMKRISRREGGSTDTSRDHEYTDWAAVDRFADELLARLARPRAAQPASAAPPAVR